MEDISVIQAKLDDIKERLVNVAAEVKTMHNALYVGQDGKMSLVNKVNHNSYRINKLEKYFLNAVRTLSSIMFLILIVLLDTNGTFSWFINLLK